MLIQINYITMFRFRRKGQDGDQLRRDQETAVRSAGAGFRTRLPRAAGITIGSRAQHRRQDAELG